MTRRLALWIGLALALVGSPAFAISCSSVTSSGGTINYVNSTTVSVQTFVAVTCSRGILDSLSVSYDIAANNGSNPQGSGNRARHASGAYLQYDLYTNSSCTTAWQGATRITGSMSWNLFQWSSKTQQHNFWICITVPQTATAAGSHLDTVTMTLDHSGSSTNVIGSFPVTIIAPPVCTMSTPPGNISLNYTAFAAGVSAATTFRVTCTSGLPYTVALDATEGVLTGVRYTLGLSSTSGTGNGAPQQRTITATVPGGQAGRCTGASCSGTKEHTLTISY